MNLLLENKVFLVTGGSRGIGQDIVLSLLQEGAFVATCARNVVPLEEMRNKLAEDMKDKLIFTECDVHKKEETKNFVEYVLRKLGRLDGIVTNAGFGTSGNVLNTLTAEWTSQYEIKLYSILNVVSPAIEALKKTGTGRIVIINGVTANRPDNNMAAVSAARAAVKQVAYMLAYELAPEILVNSINLGAIDTSRQQARYAASKTKKTYSEWEKDEAERRGIILNRYGKPQEVTPFVNLLLSPLSSYVTASSFDISGGLNVKQ